MRKNTNFYQSFTYALCGFFHAVRNERNLRFHLSAAIGVLLFAWVYKPSNIEWAVLAVTIGTVISAELVNTAVENAVDTATEEFNPFAKAAKDTAAAAVLVSAVVSIITGICIFGNVQRIIHTLKTIAVTPVYLVLFTTTAVVCVLFIAFCKDKNNTGSERKK